MGLELYHSCQCTKWGSQKQADLYGKVNAAAKKNPCLIRLSAPLVGIATGAIRIAARIGSVGEIAIKGVANIFGAPFHKDCECLKGLKQIFIQLPLAVLSVAFSPIEGISVALCDSIGITIAPETYSRWKEAASLDMVAGLQVYTKPTLDTPNNCVEQVAVFLVR